MINKTASDIVFKKTKRVNGIMSKNELIAVALIYNETIEELLEYAIKLEDSIKDMEVEISNHEYYEWERMMGDDL
ncbi:MAG: hypothetical protein ACRDA3_00110 [Peptostreptococcaceae bacterium]